MQRNDYLAEAIALTAPTYLEGRCDLTARQYRILNWLISHGRVVYNCKGYDLNWTVTAREPEVHTVNGQRQEFAPTKTEESLSIGYAKLRTTDTIDEDTIMVNDGPSAIVKIAEKKIDQLLDAMGKKLNKQFYNDDASDVNGLTGIRSLFRGVVGNNNDRMAIPGNTATYGGRSMQLGSIGGTWSADLLSADRFSSLLSNDYPDGDGTPDYDYLAPLMFNTNGVWGGATNDWKGNCEIILRRVALYIDSLGGDGAAPNLFLTNKQMLSTLKDVVSVRERLKPDDYSKGIGITGLENYEGLVMMHDFNCPSDRSFCVNASFLEMFVSTDELFYLDGPEWDIRDEAYLMSLKMKGNLRWKPKHFAEIRKYTV